MNTLAPGSLVFHRHRGYGVLTSVNLLTGWVSVKFGDEKRALDLNLSSDELQNAKGEPILFRKNPPLKSPHTKLMEMVGNLHRSGYGRLYLYIWPNASGMHHRWHLFTGRRVWFSRPWREGWYGSGADFIFNPVLGWGDEPGAGADALADALRRFDAKGLAQALGRDTEYEQWFARTCEKLLPHYYFSFEPDDPSRPAFSAKVAVHPVRANTKPYDGPTINLPPGWAVKSEEHGRPCARHLVFL